MTNPYKGMALVVSTVVYHTHDRPPQRTVFQQPTNSLVLYNTLKLIRCATWQVCVAVHWLCPNC